MIKNYNKKGCCRKNFVVKKIAFRNEPENRERLNLGEPFFEKIGSPKPPPKKLYLDE